MKQSIGSVEFNSYLLKATKETCDLGEAHAPKEASIKAFGEFEHELKKRLVHLRHEHDKHEPQNFAAAVRCKAIAHRTLCAPLTL